MRKIVSLFLIIGNVVCAQVGIGTTSPSSGAMLDITSTSSGVLIPRVTQTQRNAISSPTTGVLIYQTDNTPGFYYYDGSAWTPVGKDNLGNHTATQNINLGTTNWLSGDGGNEGISVGSSGRVGMGVTNAFEELHIHRATATPIFTLFTNGNTGGVGFSDGFLVGINSNGSVTLLNRENTNMMFSTNNLGRMIIDADGDIAVGSSSASSGAKLDVQGTNGGLLIPRLTQTQRDAIGSPSTGLLIYQTDNSPGFYYHNGTAWTGISAGAGGWGLTGNSGTTASNFIGTTDSQNFAIRTNNLERITISNTGNLGIGTTSPTDHLHLHEATATSNFIGFTDATTGTNSTIDGSVIGIFNDDLYLWNRENNHLRFGTNNTERMILTNTGRLGMGITNPTAPLHLNASVSRTIGSYAYVTASSTTPTGWYAPTSNTANYAAVFNGRVEIQGELNVTSDVRTKKVIAQKQNALDHIMQLNIVDYSKYSDMNKETGFGIVTTGILAQEVEKIDGLKHTVLQSEGNFINEDFESETVANLRTVNDKSIFYTGIAAIQELQREIEALKKENKSLKEENITLNQKMEQIDILSAKITQIQDQLSIENPTLKEESEYSQNNK